MRSEKGFAMTVVVLVLLAVTAGVTSVSVYSAVDRSRVSMASNEGGSALAFSEGCMEYALLSARNDESYDGGEHETPEGTCLVTVGKSGDEWTIESRGEEDAGRPIQATIERSATGITMKEWREI